MKDKFRHFTQKVITLTRDKKSQSFCNQALGQHYNKLARWENGKTRVKRE